VVHVCPLGLHELVQHRHLLPVGLESDGVAAGSLQTVNEDGGRDMAAAKRGLVIDLQNNAELVELVERGVLVPNIDSQLMGCLTEEQVPIGCGASVVGRVAS